MKTMRLTLTAFALLSAATAARADATLASVEGGVLISKGQGFVRTTQGTNLKVGDRVMVSQGNRGKITFPDGCSVDLRPGAVQIIGPVSPCARAQAPDNDRRSCDRALTADQRTALGCDVIGYGVAGSVIALGATAAALSLSEPNVGNGFSP